MGGINRLSTSFIALSAWQTLSGGIVATAATPSVDDNCFRRRTFHPRKYQRAVYLPASRFRNRANDALDEYEYLERTVMDCSNERNYEEESDSEARFAYELESERGFFRHSESSYLLRDVQQSESKVIPSSSSCQYKYSPEITEV